MKSLLSISLLSVMLTLCGKAPEKKEEASSPVEPQTETTAANEEVVGKPAFTGEMPDTSRRQIIGHGAPDKARNDSVKAAKTKGKF